MAGPIRVHDQTQLLLGWAHDFNETWRFQLDYQSGSANYFTVGFTCNVTARLQFNPAVYFPNGGAHSTAGYIVFTYTFPVWKPARKPWERNLGWGRRYAALPHANSIEPTGVRVVKPSAIPVQ
jgi:hypothetical protein